MRLYWASDGRAPCIILNGVPTVLHYIELRAAKRPKFSAHRGRTWDSAPIIIDGNETRAHWDTTWGWCWYVEIDGKWYRGRLAEHVPHEGLEPDRLTTTPPSERGMTDATLDTA